MRTAVFLALLLLTSLIPAGFAVSRDIDREGWDLPDIVPLPTQVPLSFEGWDRDANNDRIDDMLESGCTLDSENGMIGINVHMDGPIDRVDVGRIMDRASLLGLTPHFLRVGIYTTAIYLLVSESSIDNIPRLLTSDVNFIEYRPRIVPFLDVSSRSVRSAPSTEYSPLTAGDLSVTGEGINIAVLDSGVDNAIHESLRGKFVYGVDFTGTTTIFGVDPDDKDGHGTHVGGIALGTGGSSGKYVGTAPGASLVDLKIFKSFGTILGNSDEAFEWILENHEERNIRVVQCSFGSSVTTSGKDTTAQLANRLVDDGLVVVAAAGNDGTQGMPSPASADKVITVGAINDMGTIDRDDDSLEGFSNRGPRASDGDLDAVDELKPDLTAPGRDIMAPKHNSIFEYVQMTGTSMSCPHVSGIAALMLEADPELTPLQVKEILRDTAQQTYPPSRKDISPKYNYRSGWGSVDAYGAVKRALDLKDLHIEAPAEARAGEEIGISVSGALTKTPFDTDADTYTMKVSTPLSWGSPFDIRIDAGQIGVQAAVNGPEREGDRWSVEMTVTYNTSVEEAHPELSFSIIPRGDIGDQGQVEASSSINGMEHGHDSLIINISGGQSPPDLSIVPFAIWFSDNVPDSGDVIDITVRVNNTGSRTADDALIRLIDGPERTGEVIGETRVRVEADDYALAGFTWEANPGVHTITAIADPDDSITETNEDNNSAERPITVKGFNPPPIARLEVDPSEGTTTTRFTFDGSSSTDTNLRGGNVVSYLFDFGDGISTGWVNSSIVEHRYAVGGSFTASLVVRDNGGARSTNDAGVNINVTGVSSLKEVLYMNDDLTLSPEPGASGSVNVSSEITDIGTWTTAPFERTRVLHSLISMGLIIDSPSSGSFQYRVEVSSGDVLSATSSGEKDLGMGRTILQVDIEIEEVRIKADWVLSLSLGASSDSDGTVVATGNDGSFVEYLYYFPEDVPPEVDAGADMEVRVNSPVTFSGTASDEDGEISLLRWDVDGDSVFEAEGADAYSFTYPGYGEEGGYTVLFEARDDDGVWSSDTLKVTVRPSDYNFPPTVEILCEDGQRISGDQTIRGTADDDVSVIMVEVKISKEEDNSTVVEWTRAAGDEEWEFHWDTRGTPDGDYLIMARAFDGEKYSKTATCGVEVVNLNSDPEIISFMVDPDVIIEGTSVYMMISADVRDADMPGDILTVQADLSSMGGGANIPMNDLGEGLDREKGDGIHTAGFDVAPDLEPGTYRIFVQATDGQGRSDVGFHDVEVIHSLHMLVTIDPKDPEPDETVHVEVEVDSRVKVAVRAESGMFVDEGTNGSMELMDDGKGGDRIMGDGIYSAEFRAPAVPGNYDITFTVSSPDGKVLDRRTEEMMVVGSSAAGSVEKGGAGTALAVSGVILLVILLLSLPLLILFRRRTRTAAVPEHISGGYGTSGVVEAEVLDEDLTGGELPVE